MSPETSMRRGQQSPSMIIHSSNSVTDTNLITLHNDEILFSGKLHPPKVVLTIQKRFLCSIFCTKHSLVPWHIGSLIVLKQASAMGNNYLFRAFKKVRQCFPLVPWWDEA